MWTHKYSYCRGESEQTGMKCPFCIDESEDECHFLFRCKKYDVLRPSNLNNVECGCQPGILCRLYNDESCSASCIKQLAWFISKALDKLTSGYKVPTPTPDSNGGSKGGLSSMLADVLIGLRLLLLLFLDISA